MPAAALAGVLVALRAKFGACGDVNETGRPDRGGGRRRRWSATPTLCQVGMPVRQILVSSDCRPDVVVFVIEGRALRQAGLGVSVLRCPIVKVTGFHAKRWQLVASWRAAGPAAGYENGALKGTVCSWEFLDKRVHPPEVDWWDWLVPARAVLPRPWATRPSAPDTRFTSSTLMAFQGSRPSAKRMAQPLRRSHGGQQRRGSHDQLQLPDCDRGHRLPGTAVPTPSPAQQRGGD